eukprot:5726521-Alexandrium_andersonii.AAC.1
MVGCWGDGGADCCAGEGVACCGMGCGDPGVGGVPGCGAEGGHLAALLTNVAGPIATGPIRRIWRFLPLVLSLRYRVSSSWLGRSLGGSGNIPAP